MKGFFLALRFVVLIFLLCLSSVQSDILSTTGTISFDINDDSTAEMKMTATGLGIGTTASTNLHLMGNAYFEDSRVGINVADPVSSLEISGTLGFSLETVSSNTTLSDNSIVLADTSSANITLTLPYAGNVTGRAYTIKKISDSNTAWIVGGGNYIDDDLTLALTTSGNGFPFVEVISDGKQWYVIKKADNVEPIGSGNLVGYWKFDETSGTSAGDSSSNSNEGTLNGGFTFSGNGTIGKIGRALNLDGIDDYVSWPSGTFVALLEGASQISFSMWIKPETSSSTAFDDVVMSSGIDGNLFNLFWCNVEGASNNILVGGRSRSSDSFQSVTSSDTITLGEWAHVIGILDFANDKVRIWVNGNLNEGSVTFGSSTILNDGTPGNTDEIGNHRQDTGNVPYDGSVDDIHIYNRGLTATEVKALYDAGK